MILTTPDIGEYTPEQKAAYDVLIEAGDSLGMYVYQQTEDILVLNCLYQSFQPGTVVKYKRVVDDLNGRGRQMFEGMLDEFQAGGDISYLSPTVQELIIARAVFTELGHPLPACYK